jgi:hypothetical protein
MTILEFLVLTLATWRISSILVEEDGPFEVFDKLRHKLGVRYDEHSYPYGENELAKTLTCIWCVSPWVGLCWMLFWLAWPQVAFYVALPLALTAGLVIHGRGVRYRK